MVDIPDRLAKGGVVAFRPGWDAMSVPYLSGSNMGKGKSLRCSAAKGKDPVKPHVKMRKPLTFLLSGANSGVEIMDTRAQERRITWSVFNLYPTLHRINRTPSSLKSGSGVGADLAVPRR